MTGTLLNVSRFLFSLGVATAIVACAGNSPSGVPQAAGTSQVVAVPDAGGVNYAGQYSGSVEDSIVGYAFATASLAQQKHNVGGVVNETINNENDTNPIVLHASGTTLTGAEVAPNPPVGSGPCSFSVKARYNTGNFVLSGSYTAVHGCSGESGTFSLTENCSYPRNGSLEATGARKGRNYARPDHGVTEC